VSGRANRRAARASARGAPARSRRTPVRAAGGGRNLPWVPIAVVAGIALVLGAVVYLVIQAGKSPGTDNAKWAAVEKATATSTTLPGEGVDLQAIYKGSYGSPENNTGAHVTFAMDYAKDQGLPPTGGPHWGSGACGEHVADSGTFCGPVQYGIYRAPDFWEPESLVHSMEHGGLVVWYNTTNQQVIDELEAVVQGYLENDALIVMVPYQEMEEETIALTIWARRDKFPVSEYTKERVETFIDTMKCRFNPESFPGSGC